jgi:hypothetical protein
VCARTGVVYGLLYLYVGGRFLLSAQTGAAAARCCSVFCSIFNVLRERVIPTYSRAAPRARVAAPSADALLTTLQPHVVVLSLELVSDTQQ